MNRYDENNMRGRTVIQERCVFCGRPVTNQHHVVYRSRGGSDGPTLSVCGSGNATGCHRLLHGLWLHPVWFGDRWMFCYTSEPTKIDKVMSGMDRTWMEILEDVD